MPAGDEDIEDADYEEWSDVEEAWVENKLHTGQGLPSPEEIASIFATGLPVVQEPRTVDAIRSLPAKRQFPEQLRAYFHFSQADCVIDLLSRRKQGTVGYTEVYHEKTPKQWVSGCRMAFTRAWDAARRQARRAGRHLDQSLAPRLSIRKHKRHDSGFYFCEMCVLYKSDLIEDTSMLELFADSEKKEEEE